MKLKKDSRQHHFCPFTDNIPYTNEQQSHHKVSTHPRSSPSFCQILSMILISCRVNMSCRRSDQIIKKKLIILLSIPYNKTKIQFFVWLYLTYFSRANTFGAVNAWSRPHSALILAFPAFSFSHFFSFRFFWAHAQSNRSAAHVLETILIYCGCTSYPDKVNTEDLRLSLCRGTQSTLWMCEWSCQPNNITNK